MKLSGLVGTLASGAILLALTSCSGASPAPNPSSSSAASHSSMPATAAPTKTFSLSQNPSWPANCKLVGLAKDYPGLTNQLQSNEDGDPTLMDGLGGNDLGCTSDGSNSAYDGDVSTWPLTFAYHRSTSSSKAWATQTIDVYQGNHFLFDSIDGCQVLYDSHIPNGSSSKATDAHAYCNGMTIDFWSPSDWKTARLQLQVVIEAMR